MNSAYSERGINFLCLQTAKPDNGKARKTKSNTPAFSPLPDYSDTKRLSTKMKRRKNFLICRFAKFFRRSGNGLSDCGLGKGRLFVAVYAFYPLRDGGEDFVGNGVEGFRHVLHGVFLSEDDDSVSYGGVYAAKVYHAHVHADVSNDGCHASVNPHFETSW